MSYPDPVASDDDTDSPIFHAACAEQRCRGERSLPGLTMATTLVRLAGEALSNQTKRADDNRVRCKLEGWSERLFKISNDLQEGECSLWEDLHPLPKIRAEIVAAAREGMSS